MLDYEARYIRRKVLTCVSGTQLLIDLEKATVLEHGDLLETETDTYIAITAADEDLLEIKAENAHALTICAYHLGNRHLPVQIEQGRLLIQHDHVIIGMLDALGAQVQKVREPFNPVGGAYGHGRTHGHDHGHSHAETHSHD